MDNKIKVFVGCAANGEDAESQAVLEYSLRLHASEPVDIVWMKLSRDPASFWYSDGENGWQTQQWATPFSGFRWAIPEYCKFQGKAIYMDSDMIINADIAELWNKEFQPGKVVIQKNAPGRLDVSLWNCAEAQNYILPLKRLQQLPNSHARMMNVFASNEKITQTFEDEWNSFDGENHKLEDVKILHYTDMSTQPHLTRAIKRLAEAGLTHWFDGTVVPHRRKDVVLWFDVMLKEAHAHGFTTNSYIPEVPYGPYNKQSQKGYQSNNGFDVRQNQ
jgi:hypothetical protein